MATNGKSRVARDVLTLVVVVCVAMLAPPVLAEPGPVVYTPPVEAPVVDDFRPPAGRYGSGNRGLTYDLAPGTAVRAAADGTVTFAGTVANSQHVTIEHADGLRSSYSFLTSIGVVRGQRIDAGDVVGTAASGFHFGVRDGQTYLDPADLFAGLEVRVRLVGSHPPAPSAAEVAADRHQLGLLVRLWSPERWLLGEIDDLVDYGKRSVRILAQEVVEAIRVKAHAASDLHQRLSPRTIIDRVAQVLRRSRRECTEADETVAVPSAQQRVAVTVAGYASNSDSAAVDAVRTRQLGYADEDVVRFSYLGGRVPGSVAPDLASIPQNGYEPRDTFADLRQRGVALADLLAAVAARRPGQPVDVFAHSQGGIVTRLALIELERRGMTDILGVVTTIGSPHRGADLATAGVALGPLGVTLVEVLTGAVGATVDPNATSIRQMAEDSALMRELDAAGVPDDVDFHTIGARGDLVVPASRTTVDGVEDVIVDLMGLDAHSALPGAVETTRELTLALTGRPPGCEGIGGVALDTVAADAVTSFEDIVTLLVPVL